MKVRQTLFLLLLLLCPCLANAQTPAVTEEPVVAQPAVRMSPGARQMAGLIGLTELLDRYFRLPARERSFNGAMSSEAMLLRLQINEAILFAALEADGILAEIDSEIETILDTRTYLEARRDRALGIGTIAGIVAGGAGGVIGTAMQFGESTATTGNIIGVAGGAVSTLLSVVGLRQQRGGQREFSDAPNMLAQFFERTGEFYARYPEAAWQYFNAPVPTEPEKGTRRERMRRDWITEGRIESEDSAKAREKIDFLTSPASAKRKLTIDRLNDREAMLTDVRIWVKLMKRDLSKLLLAVRTQ